MTEYYGVALNDIFDTMQTRFRKEAAPGSGLVLGYDITGEGKWKLTITGDKLVVNQPQSLNDCSVTAHMDGRTFVGINLGKVDVFEATQAGKLRLSGDAALFDHSGRLFKKFVPAGANVQPDQELLVLKKTISVGQRFATGPIMGKFLHALRDKKILAIKCPTCGRLQSPPREACAICRVRNTDWIEIGPGGTLRMLEYAFYASPDPLTGETRETPYGSIGVLLDGCSGEEVFWHLLRPDQLDRVEMGIELGDEVKIGTRLRPVWAEKRTGSIEDIVYFEIDEPKGGAQ